VLFHVPLNNTKFTVFDKSVVRVCELFFPFIKHLSAPFASSLNASHLRVFSILCLENMSSSSELSSSESSDSSDYPDKDGNYFLPGSEDCCSCCERCYKENQTKMKTLLSYCRGVHENIKYQRYMESVLLKMIHNPPDYDLWE
jgi:hypothetical protein